MENTALIIIDIQKNYFPGGNMVQTGADEAGLNAKSVLERFRQKQLPVFHIQHETLDPNKGSFIRGTEAFEIHDHVKPIEGEPVILKHTPSSFFNTNLAQHLESRKIKNLVIVGMMTLMCVDSTVRSAFELGYNCTVIGDATASMDLTYQGKTIPAEQVKGAFLSALELVFARVQNTSDFLREFN